MLNPWLGMGAVFALLGGLTVLLRVWQRRVGPHPELVRKLLHIGMGLVTLSFPWIFATAWPVVALAAASVVALLAVRLTPLGRVLSAVGRASLGEVYFPIAVAILFVLYHHDTREHEHHRLVLYLVPILLLTLADAAAALVGVGYGLHTYLTADGHKSAEGSVAFFTCAYFSVHVPVLLLTENGRAETLVIALLLAFLATMFEAIAWRGLDNLALPLVSYLLLATYLDLQIEMLLIRCVITVALIAFVVSYRGRTTLIGTGMLGAYLVGYICWAVGGWQWFLAPLGMFVMYSRLSPIERRNPRQVHNIHAVVSVAAAGLVWLFLAQRLSRWDFLLPFTIAFAGHLAIAGIARLKCDYPHLSDWQIVPECIGVAWLIEFALYFVAAGISTATIIGAVAGLVGIAVVALLFYLTQPALNDCPVDSRRWTRQALAAAFGSLIGLIPLQFWGSL